MPITSDGLIEERALQVNGKRWTIFSVGGTPAQTVLHAILEILPERPDLVVSGINYGENLGTGITVSGTVGAALEAASFGIPALAMSLETESEYHLSYSPQVDFTVAGYFTTYFARLLIDRRLPADVNVLKVDVPSTAVEDTPWEITRLSRRVYYEPLRPDRETWDQPGRVGYRIAGDPSLDEADTDVYALRILRHVSVTPLSLDMTSRVDFDGLASMLRGQEDQS